MKSYGVGDGVVRQGVAEFLWAVYGEHSTICNGLAAISTAKS